MQKLLRENKYSALDYISKLTGNLQYVLRALFYIKLTKHEMNVLLCAAAGKEIWEIPETDNSWKIIFECENIATKTAEKLLNQKASIFYNDGNDSAFLLACKNGKPLLLRLFLESSEWKSATNSRSYLNTGIVHAASLGHLEATKILLENGASPHYIQDENEYLSVLTREGPLYGAVLGNHAHVVRLLLQYSTLDIGHSLPCVTSVEVFELLFQKGVQPADVIELVEELYSSPEHANEYADLIIYLQVNGYAGLILFYVLCWCVDFDHDAGIRIFLKERYDLEAYEYFRKYRNMKESDRIISETYFSDRAMVGSEMLAISGGLIKFLKPAVALQLNNMINAKPHQVKSILKGFFGSILADEALIGF